MILNKNLWFWPELQLNEFPLVPSPIFRSSWQLKPAPKLEGHENYFVRPLPIGHPGMVRPSAWYMPSCIARWTIGEKNSWQHVNVRSHFGILGFEIFSFQSVFHYSLSFFLLSSWCLGIASKARACYSKFYDCANWLVWQYYVSNISVWLTCI